VIDVFGHPAHPTTVNFVRTVIQDRLPDSIRDELRADTHGRRLRLEFIGLAANRPIINNLIKRFEVEVNILYASMSEVQDVTLGFMMVQLNGEAGQIDAAMTFLAQAGVDIQEIDLCSTQL